MPTREEMIAADLTSFTQEKLTDEDRAAIDAGLKMEQTKRKFTPLKRRTPTFNERKLRQMVIAETLGETLIGRTPDERKKQDEIAKAVDEIRTKGNIVDAEVEPTL